MCVCMCIHTYMHNLYYQNDIPRDQIWYRTDKLSRKIVHSELSHFYHIKQQKNICRVSHVRAVHYNINQFNKHLCFISGLLADADKSQDLNISLYYQLDPSLQRLKTFFEARSLLSTFKSCSSFQIGCRPPGCRNWRCSMPEDVGYQSWCIRHADIALAHHPSNHFWHKKQDYTPHRPY